MKQRPISKTISLVIAWQLAVSPMALAVEGQTPTTPRTEGSGGVPPGGSSPGGEQRSSESWTKTFADIMQGTTAMGNALIQGMQQRYSQIAAQNQLNALTQQMNPSNCGANGARQQCVDEIFPECNILNTRPNLVEPSACTNGIDGGQDPNAAANKAGIVMGYYNHFSQMENIYKNFNLETNATSNTGLGCLNAQADRLARTLKKREEEIDNLINKMQKVQDKFKKEAEEDRNKIEDAQALLLGNEFKGRKGSLEQNSVQFGDSFADKGCLSVLNRDQFNNTGKSGGLKGIEAALSKSANDKVQPGGFSAAEFDTNTAASLEKDIRKMADLASKNIQTFGLDNTETDKLTKAIPSSYALTGTPAFGAAITESLSDAKIQKANVMKEVESYAGNADRSLIDNLQNDKADFNFAVQNWERDQKNTCLTGNSNISDLVANRLKIIDPSNSKSAQRESDNAYAIFIRDTLKRSDIAIEEKLRLIASQEGQNGNKRFIVNTQSSATVNGSVIEASTRMSPARFVEVMVKNCEEKFERNPNSQGYTGRQVVEKLQKARQEISKIQQNVAGQVKTAIIDRMLNCADSNLANANGVGTCSAKELSSSSANFCVKRANACATNMRQCLTKAQEQVKKVTKKRDEAVAQYKANVRKNQEDLRKMYLQVEQITSVDGLNIANSLKQSLVLPTDLKFNLDPNGQAGGEKTQFIAGLESLEVQDPDQYFQLMKKNLTELKKKVHDQNVAVMNGTQGDLAVKDSDAQQGVLGHIANVKKNMDNIMGDISKFKEMCKGAFQAYVQGAQRARADAMRAQQEAAKKQAEEQNKICRRFNALRKSPVPGCEQASELADTIAEATSFNGGEEAAGQLAAYGNLCQRYSSTSQDEAPFAKVAGVNRVADACKSDRPYADKITSICSDFTTWNDTCKKGMSEAQTTCQKQQQDRADAKERDYQTCKTNATTNGAPDTAKLQLCESTFPQSSREVDPTRVSSCVTQMQTSITNNNEICSKKDSDFQADIARVLSGDPQFASDSQAAFQRELQRRGVNNLGELSIAACDGQNNSGNAIGKAFTDLANTIGQGAVNMQAAGANSN